ncbi:MAG: pyroglutamyl-peptidase I [bacterium]|nr:pyroglutamyl-peptidase I [bacterium]
MEKRLLITGFEPFGGERVNPSWEAVSRMRDGIGEWKLKKLQVPTVFGVAAETVLQAAEEFEPDVILCIGQAGGRCLVTPEYVAVNLRDAAVADNAGNMPCEELVAADGPNAYFSTVPCRKIAEAVRSRGIASGVSYSAGVYVCNDLFYTLCRYYEKTAVRVGFIHVPYLPEQAGNRWPSLPLDVIVQALEAAVSAL